MRARGQQRGLRRSQPGEVIGGSLLSLSQHNLRVLSEHGTIELGTPNATVQTASAKLTATPPTVTLTACLDSSSVPAGVQPSA